jgi:hypothetical protein
VLRDDADVLRAIGPQILAIRREKLQRLRRLQIPPDERSGWANSTALMDETYDALAVAIKDARAEREPDMSEVQRLGDALAATSAPYEFTWCP